MRSAPTEETLSPFVALRRSQEAAVAARARPRRRHRHRRHEARATLVAGLGLANRLWQRLLVAVAAVVVLLAVALLSFRASYAERVYPAIRVGGVSVGGLTQEAAIAAVQSETDALQQGFVTFTYQGATWRPRLTDLGVSMDIAGSVAVAMAYGRDSHAVDRLLATGTLVHDDHEVPLALRLDHAVLNAWFDQVDAELAGDLGLRPHDAYLVIDGTEVRIESEIPGTVVDRARATARIEQALINLQPLTEPLPAVNWVPRVHASDLDAAESQIEDILAKSVKVTFADESWSVKPADFGRFIVQEVDPNPSLTGARAVIVRVDEGALASWLDDRFAEDVNHDPVDAELGWEDGAVVALSESENGHRLRPKSFARDLAASYFGDHESVAISASTVAPEVDSTNLEALGITTELSRTSSNFEGSNPERAENIAVGAFHLNGTLIPPGDVFSFNHSIGEIREDRGFVEAKVIDGERIDRDVGGGICQVSTAVFRAALMGGLPMVEWNPHRYQLDFYERDGWAPGYDASIMQPEGDPFRPGNDFQFLNPTNYWMLVESWVEGTSVVVVIYGVELGYEVKVTQSRKTDTIPIDPPLEVVDEDLPEGTVELTELPQEGAVYIFVREVFDANGNQVESREFRTVFHSRGYVYRVSPDMEGQSPAKTGQGLPES